MIDTKVICDRCMAVLEPPWFVHVRVDNMVKRTRGTAPLMRTEKVYDFCHECWERIALVMVDYRPEKAIG